MLHKADIVRMSGLYCFDVITCNQEPTVSDSQDPIAGHWRPLVAVGGLLYPPALSKGPPVEKKKKTAAIGGHWDHWCLHTIGVHCRIKYIHNQIKLQNGVRLFVTFASTY